jgi:hypothetical protein
MNDQNSKTICSEKNDDFLLLKNKDENHSPKKRSESKRLKQRKKTNRSEVTRGKAKYSIQKEDNSDDNYL